MNRKIPKLLGRAVPVILVLASMVLSPLRAQEGTASLPEIVVPDYYKIRPGDTVNVSVFNESELGVSQKLDPDGVIIIPLLGRTKLDGLTLREAENYIEELFIEQQFLIAPQVTVSMAGYAEQVFYIFGEVRSPGAKTFPTNKQRLDILEAITMAGDVSQYAKRSEIIIRRPVKGQDREEKIVVDLDKMIRGSSRGDDELISIYPDDIIFVPERLF